MYTLLVEFQIDVVIEDPRQRYPDGVRVEILVDGRSQGRAHPLHVRFVVVRLQLGPVFGEARLFFLDYRHDVAYHVQLVPLFQPIDIHQQFVVQTHDSQVYYAVVGRRGGDGRTAER